MTCISKSLLIFSAGLLCAFPLLNAQSTAGSGAGPGRDDSPAETGSPDTSGPLIKPPDTLISPPIGTITGPANDQNPAKPTTAAKPLCSLSGVTQNPDGQPLAQVQVLVHGILGDKQADTTDRTVTSAADGSFCVANLKPGRYELTGKTEGFATTSATKVDVADQQNAAVNLPLAKSATTNAVTGGFFKRFIQAYHDDWTGTATSSGPEPAYRGDPAPVTTPPFPFAMWPIGGTVWIGQPWTQSAPLMQAIWSGKHGDWWKRSGIQIYGWLNGGINASTSKQSGYSTYPEAYAERGNSPELDQEVLYIEREPDTVQTDHVDWGFRLSGLYGLDYRFTTAAGWFSNQLLGKNQEMGFDLPMAYFDLYIPALQGIDIRIGRYISLPDIEAQLAPNNYTYSHSLLYTFDAYTQTGINVTMKFSDHWTWQVGLSPGNDVAPWDLRDAKLTLNTCLAFTWRTALDNIYVCENSLNNGHYAYNNLQASYLTWYHKFSKDGSWHTDTEMWYQYEKHTPNVNNPVGETLVETGANGAFCALTTQITCFAPEFAIVNYSVKQLSKHDYLTIRNEFFDDLVGQRTGFKTPYTEHLVGWGHWVGSTVLFRPEMRWEHSYDLPVYDNGTRHSQLTFAADVILFF
jgi:Putative beta-barrel porin-2, OmpL-like. bbp2/Carboxypeptidase regulatory-like domain